jgi:uncharacterized membrane protein YqjE
MGLAASLSELGSGLLLAARQRLELAALDVEEEFIRLACLLAMAVAAALLATLALAAGAAAIAAHFWDTARIPALLGIALAFALGAGALAWRMARAWRAKPAFLAATLATLHAQEPGRGPSEVTSTEGQLP